MRDHHQPFVQVVLKQLQRHGATTSDGAPVSEPSKALVQVPPPASATTLSNLEAKSLASYFKKRRAALDDAPAATTAAVAVVAVFPRKSGLKLVSPVKHKLPFLLADVHQDMFRQDQEAFLRAAAERVPNLRDAFRLVSFWVERNQAEQQTEGALPALALHLALASAVEEPKMWSKASTLQLFKRALKWLAESALETHVARVGGAFEDKFNFPDADFQAVFPVCLVWQNVFNVAHGVLPSAYRLLRQQAVQALASQDDEEALLMRRTAGGPFERFDLLLRIPIPPAPKETTAAAAAEGGGLGWRGQFVRKAEALAHEALVQSGRVTEFGFFHSSSSSMGSAGGDSGSGVVILGLLIDPEQTFRLLDKGPASEDAEQSAKFRDFWGELAELRRFKDGSVLESVVWPDFAKRLIPQKIMEHVLRRHASPASTVALVGTALDADNGMREEAHILHAIERYGALEQRIRAVPGLPLKINHISLADAPTLRYTRGVPRKLTDEDGASSSSSGDGSFASRCLPIVAQVLVQFESTSRFPKEEEARKKVETVLLIELAKGLEKSTTTSTGGAEEGAAEQVAEDVLACFVTSERYMDVITTVGGYAFRIKLVRPGASGGESAVTLHTKLHNLHHSTLFGAPRSFGSVCRLVKRWVSGQQFSSVLPDNLVDVLVASIFTKRDPPRSGLCGLFRFFDLLTKFDWRSRALVVSLEEPYDVSNARKNAADGALFRLRGNSKSGGGPPAVVFVYTSAKKQREGEEEEEEAEPSVFPDALAMHPLAWQRIVERAAASRAYLEKLCILDGSDSGVDEEAYWTALFASEPSEGFDAVLWVDCTASGRLVLERASGGGGGGRKKARYQNLVPLHLESEALVGVDPVASLLARLRREFDEYAIFFAGDSTTNGGGVQSIGLVWKQRELAFTLANTKYARSNTTSTMLRINEEELVHAMVQAGRGLVTAGEVVVVVAPM